MRNKVKVQLLELLIERRLTLLKHEIVVVRLASEGIDHDIGLAKITSDSKIEVSYCFHPMLPMKVGRRLSKDILETFVVGEDFTTAAEKVVSPSLKRMDDGCELEIMSWVVLLNRLEVSRSIINHLALLHENDTKSMKRSITKDLESLGVSGGMGIGAEVTFSLRSWKLS